MTHVDHRARACALGLAAWVALGAPAAEAQEDIARRRVGVSWEDGVPRVSFRARDLVSGRTRQKLSSGLPQTMVVRVYAFDAETDVPVAVTPRSCRVVYDLWEEVYRIQIQTESSDEAVTVGDLADALERCLIVRRQRVGRASDFRPLRGRQIYFAALVELNPLSEDTVERIRRWLARPSGGRMESDAFFGSFVSLFVNRRIGAAERTVRFRSQTVRIPR